MKKKIFHITSTELNIVNDMTKPSNKLGFAVLLKSFQYLGYFPYSKSEIPRLFVENIALSLEMSPSLFKQYKWKNRTWDYHVDKIRTLTSFKVYDSNITEELKGWIANQERLFPSRKNIAYLLLTRFREIKLELPSEEKFQRLVNTLRKIYYDKTYKVLDKSLSETTKTLLEKILKLKGRKKGSFTWIKSPSGEAGLKSILIEIEKLKLIRSFTIEESLIENLHPKLIEQLYRRCRSHNSNRLEELSDEQRFTLLCIFYYVRQMEITDGIIKIFLELIKRIEKKSKKSIEKEVNKDVKKNYNKQLILKKITLAIKNNPKGTIEEVILAVVDLETFNDLADEYENSHHSSYNAYKTSTMKRKYTSF